MPTKGGKRFMTSAIDFCPRQPLPVAQGLANGQHRRISSLLLRTGTSGVVLNRFRRHLRQCWFDLVESVQIGVYYDKHSIAHSTLDPLLQWVETNQSNLRIYPTDIRISRLMVLRWRHWYRCSQMLDGLVSSHPFFSPNFWSRFWPRVLVDKRRHDDTRRDDQLPIKSPTFSRLFGVLVDFLLTLCTGWPFLLGPML
jgi:hypothetical protein